MRSQNKGFDPLSSLFAQGGPTQTQLVHPGLASEDEPPVRGDDPGQDPKIDHIDLTDPRYKIPAGMESVPPAVAPAAVEAPTDAPDPGVRPTGMPVDVGPAPDAVDDGSSDDDRAVSVDQEAPARDPVSAQERADIARAIGKAAAARAAAAAKAAAPPAPVVPAATAPAPEPVSRRAAKASTRPMSRMEALASRTRRPVSAAQAARLAAEEEAQKNAEIKQDREVAQARARQQQVNALSNRVQELIPECLPNVGAVYVANAIVAEQRPVLSALWKAHRTKFLLDGQLERAVGAAAVLHALDHVARGKLVAAHVVTDASDYLVWLDMDSESLLAAFSDARAYFAGPQQP